MTAMETIQLLGNLGEFVGAIAVFATLLYLAVQVREAKKASTFAAVQANRAERIAGFLRQRDSPYLPQILVKVDAGEALSPEETNRLFAHDAATWAQLYAEWVQRELGFMGEFATRDEVGNAVAFGSNSARRWWEVGGRNIYPRRFVDYIDAAMAEFDRSSDPERRDPVQEMMLGR